MKKKLIIGLGVALCLLVAAGQHMAVSVDKVYPAIEQVETGGVKDPFIRTKGHSTAYGPVQITGLLMKDSYVRYGGNFSKEEKEYMLRFITQAKAFKEIGVGRYGPGGSGDLTNKTDRAMYEIVAKKIMTIKLDKSKGNVTNFIVAWRGLADSNYIAKVKSKL